VTAFLVTGNYTLCLKGHKKQRQTSLCQDFAYRKGFYFCMHLLTVHDFPSVIFEYSLTSQWRDGEHLFLVGKNSIDSAAHKEIE
jgi:hypothetical protein